MGPGTGRTESRMGGNVNTEMISQQKLKERGWTDGLIKKYLPNADQTSPNPYYNNGASMRWYLLSRVKQIESTRGWQADKAKAEKRQQSALKGVDTKLAKMKEHLDDIEIKVPKLSREYLVNRACQHYNDRQRFRSYGEGSYATPTSDEPFLQRITVNYLRHTLTEYEPRLKEVKGKVGRDDAYFEINRKIYNAISEKYPDLKDECDRQMANKESEG